MKRSSLAAALLIALALPAASPAAYQSTYMVTSRFGMVASGASVVDDGVPRLFLDVKDTPGSSYSVGAGVTSLVGSHFIPAGYSQLEDGLVYYGYKTLRLRIAYAIAAPDAD